jgi:hypothetical protein
MTTGVTTGVTSDDGPPHGDASWSDEHPIRVFVAVR